MPISPPSLPIVTRINNALTVGAGATTQAIILDAGPNPTYMCGVWGILDTGNASSYIELELDRGGDEGILFRHTGAQVAFFQAVEMYVDGSIDLVVRGFNNSGSSVLLRYGYTRREFIGL